VRGQLLRRRLEEGSVLFAFRCVSLYSVESEKKIQLILVATLLDLIYILPLIYPVYF
jgi:hypothetical protein